MNGISRTVANSLTLLSQHASTPSRKLLPVMLQVSRTVHYTAPSLGSPPRYDVPIEAQFKNPIVSKLWSARQEAKQRLRIATETSSNDGNQNVTTSDCVPPSKSPSESQTEISYPFSTEEILKEAYQNPWGEMRFGKILEDLDALAGNIAFHHVFGNPVIVTAGVDRIRIRKRPLIGQDVHLSGKVTWVGTSSMEIRMQCSESETCEEWLEAYFTFVCLDPDTKKACRIPPLLPETKEERAHFELGALKAQAKKQSRKNRIQVGQPLTEGSLKIDQEAAALLEEAGPLLRMPSLAASNSILMGSTAMQNAMIAQPQVRNLHDRIFGGFLMRRAFELAFANAYVFGGKRPIFLEVDDISFESAVDIGDLLVFNSRVLYTAPEGGFLGDYLIDHKGMPLVMVEVEAWVTEPERAQARVSNHFHFTFALPEGSTCRQVLPGNIDEARRMATRMMADKEQAALRS